jgi:hypothetical protein
MTYRGKVQGGIVVLDGQNRPPEGAVVSVSVVEAPRTSDATAPTWAEVFKGVIGKAQGLPTDSSVNHDHYLYGVRKRR